MPRLLMHFQIDQGQVYQPAEDTFLLLEAASQEIQVHDRVLEVGVGSGYISSHLRSLCRFLVATDRNPHAAGMAYSSGVPVVLTDLSAGLVGPFDLILFNPPYLPTDPAERIDDWLELALDGGCTGRDVIARFLQEIPEVLAPKGRVLLLISSLTGMRETAQMIQVTGWNYCEVARDVVDGGEILQILRLERKK
ncbi:MAG: methylase [Methanospirillum sp.]|uniref:HemK2/MTQ2 family protein methyltransferase n=1 Tax=Methanospirillum sp. TaxID=45200 RepID=UPI0023701F9D|nr:HemK2/MTQ2 family protein methyltransferase [Methanospirillum sp.]MDD1729049.1 methylase [Methanospirillum sp.]